MDVRRRRDRPGGAFGYGSMASGMASRPEVGRQPSVAGETRWQMKSGKWTAHHSACAASATSLFFPSTLSASMALESAPSQDESVGTSKQAFSLENILGDNHENIEHPATATNEAANVAGGWDEEAGQEHIALGFCVECEGASCH